MDKVIFDVDDVLVNDAFLGVVKEFCKIHLNRKVEKEDVGAEYYYEKVIFGDDNEIIQKFYDYFLTKDMYDYGIIEEGAVELLEEFSKTHEVFVYTCATLKGRENASGILFKNKFDMLCKTFPFLNPSNFIIGANKSIICADYMVDDRVDNLSGNIRVKMLYSAPHNMNISDKELYDKGIFRVSNMHEVRKVVYGKYTNLEMIEIVNKYLTFVAKYENTICQEIKVNVKSEDDIKVYIILDCNERSLYQQIGIKNAEEFEKFLSNRLGVSVYFLG